MLNRLISLALAGALSCGLISPSWAAQGSGCMPTTGTVSGLTFAQDVNAGIAALISSNSGAAAPVTDCTAAAVKGQIWLDTSVTPNAFRQYDGSSTWVTIGYLDASNHLFVPPIGGGSSSVASASTVDLGALPNAAVTVSGTTTITSFGSSAVIGTVHLVKFSGSLTLTYNATSLILPNSANIVTQGNDVAVAQYLGSGNWQVIAYTPANVSTKASPTTSDYALIYDAAASNTPKKSLLSAIAALNGVTGIDSKTGAFTTANGIESTGGNVIQLPAGRRTLPTVQIFTSGNGTYTTPANVLWVEILLVGGGAGGGGSGGSGGAGGASCWNTSGAACTSPVYSAGGGVGTSGAGGAITGSGTCQMAIVGGSGSPTLNAAAVSGAPGAASSLGGAGAGSIGGTTGTGQSAASNSGSGGGGGTVGGGGFGSGASGATCYVIVNSPASTYTYVVGAAGVGGTSGGGAGGSGYIRVIEHYGS